MYQNTESTKNWNENPHSNERKELNADSGHCEEETAARNKAVQKTMLIPLWGRAQASRLYPEILADQDAVNIIETLDLDFSPIASSFDGFGAMSHLVRTRSMDDATRSYCSQHPGAAVVNIGCGLDTNFGRLDNGQMRWFDLDLPDSIAFRSSVIPRLPRAQNLAFSMFDTEWFQKIGFQRDQGAFFIAAGVFYFFKEESIRELLVKMAEAFPGGELVFDANSSIALEHANQMMKQTGNKNAAMYFSVDDPGIFEGWSPKIRVKSAKSRFLTTPRLPQMPDEMKARMDYCDENMLIKQIHLEFL